MAIKTSLIDPTDGTAIAVEKPWDISHGLHGDELALMVTSPAAAHGAFQSLERSTAGTDQIVTPTASGAVRLTDFLISTERLNGGTVTVQWNDGTDTALIFKGFATDAPINNSLSFTGRVQGWENAWIEWTIVGSLDSSIILTYVKIPEGLPFAEWDALR